MISNILVAIMAILALAGFAYCLWMENGKGGEASENSDKTEK